MTFFVSGFSPSLIIFLAMNYMKMMRKKKVKLGDDNEM